MAQNSQSLLEQEALRSVTARRQHPASAVSPLLRAETAAPAASRNAARCLGVDFLHEIGSRMAASDPLHTVLNRIVDFACSVINCDSCFVYVLESNQLVFRASKNPHADIVDHLGIWLGQGITGWVGWHREPVAISCQGLAGSALQALSGVA